MIAYIFPGLEYPRCSFGRPQSNARPGGTNGWTRPSKRRNGQRYVHSDICSFISLMISPDRRRKASPPREAYAYAMANNSTHSRPNGNAMLGAIPKAIGRGRGKGERRIGLDGTQGRHRSQRRRRQTVTTRRNRPRPGNETRTSRPY